MGSPKEKSSGMTVTYWAVGRCESSSLVALQLNGEQPLLLSITDARGMATALQEEADAVAQREADCAKQR